MGGQLGSWENAFGVRGEQIPPGEEKWSIPEGSYVTLKRHGHPDFYLRRAYQTDAVSTSRCPTCPWSGILIDPRCWTLYRDW